MTNIQLNNLIHNGQNPYVNINVDDFDVDLSSGIFVDFFIDLSKVIRDGDTIIEVGTWEGASAIGMGKILRDLGIKDFSLLCVDTWLGSSYTREGDYLSSLKIKDGYPQLFYHFLKNVKKSGLDKNIIPFPIQSFDAARFLKKHDVMAKVVYIDASHVYPDVYFDIKLYWDLLCPGGILCGDDYTWIDVKFSIERFSQEKNLQLQVFYDKYVLIKQ